MGKPWFQIWLSENLGSMGFSFAPKEGNQSEVQTWQIKQVNKDNGTMLVSADDRLSLRMKLGYRFGASSPLNLPGSGVANTNSGAGAQRSVDKSQDEIIESYEEGDNIAVAVPGGELGKTFIIKKLTGMKTSTFTNLVIGNGED